MLNSFLYKKTFLLRAENFYKYGVLPELLGKWYSKKPIFPSSTDTMLTTSSNNTSDMHGTTINSSDPDFTPTNTLALTSTSNVATSIVEDVSGTVISNGN